MNIKSFFPQLMCCSIVGLASSQTANAAGFMLIENSASGMGNAFAGASAIAEDASTIWFNPAGMSLLKDNEILFAGHFIKPSAQFTNNGSSEAPSLGGSELLGGESNASVNAYVPNFYWLTAIADDWKVGLGITAPFGLTTLYDDDWLGRYHGVESDLTTININPSLSYQLTPELSLGAGINMMFADVVFTNAVDFGALCYAALNPESCESLGNTPQQADGFADLRADNFSEPGFGANLGLIYQFSQQSRLGLSWRSEVTINVEGQAQFRVPASADFITDSGLFQNTALKAKVVLPQTASMSYVHRFDKLTLLSDITWTGWSSFKELRIQYDNPDQPDSVTTENWNDSFRYSLGLSYELNSWLLRTGLAYDETPVPDAQHRTVRIPGNSRTWLSFGGQYKINSSWLIDVAYAHLFVEPTDIDNSFESDVPTLNANIKGQYEASVDIISAQIRWTY